MISLVNVSARAMIDRARIVLDDVTLEHRAGVLGVLGTRVDGTSLLCDVLDGTAKPTAGRVTVLDALPATKRALVARVSADAPLPEALRVDEVCALESTLRGGPAPPPKERLAILGIEALLERSVRSLSLPERRAVALAVALTSAARLVLVEEPLTEMDPVAARRVADALRARAAAASIIVTTSSARDAARLADNVGILTLGRYSALDIDAGHLSFGTELGAAMRIVVAPSAGKAGAAKLAGNLSAVDIVTHVEVASFVGGAVAISVRGTNLAQLARTVTSAIASTRVDIELVETAALSLDAIRTAMAARAVSPPPGSLPPGRLSIPPEAASEAQAASVRPSLPPPSIPPRRPGGPS